MPNEATNPAGLVVIMAHRSASSVFGADRAPIKNVPALPRYYAEIIARELNARAPASVSYTVEEGGPIEAAPVALVDAAADFLAEFGGDVSEWLRPAADRLAKAVEAAKPARCDVCAAPGPNPCDSCLPGCVASVPAAQPTAAYRAAERLRAAAGASLDAWEALPQHTRRENFDQMDELQSAIHYFDAHGGIKTVDA